MKIVRLRGYLAFLQALFLLLYCVRLQPASTSPLPIGPILTLAVLSLVVTVPGTHLQTPWFIGLLTVSNAGILLITVPTNLTTDPGTICALTLLLAMASYIPSLIHFVMVCCLLVGGYAVSLYQVDVLQTDAVLFLTTLLCLTLVFLSKMGMVQAEIQRMTEHQDRSRQETMIDALTGLPNRAQFFEQVERIIQYRQINKNFHFAVLFLDLDGFKPINDRLGHKSGDLVLRHVAKLLQGGVRKGDVVGRYGGDEFTVLLNQVEGPSDAIRVAEHLLARIQTPIAVGETVHVGASIGIAFSTNLHERAEDLVRDADAAMYRAKAKGKNCYVLSDQTVDTPEPELKSRWKRLAQLRR